MRNATSWKGLCRVLTRKFLLLASIGSTLYGPLAQGFEIATEDPDLTLRWDNTVKYNAVWRQENPSAILVNSRTLTDNQDDGDRNFNKGLISNRVDLFSEFEATYKSFGVRLSGAAWYDDVYNQANDNSSAATVNSRSVAPNQFTAKAVKVHGRDSELLDAFVFGKTQLADMPTSFRIGQYSLLWGETLFFGNNGISGTQAAVNVVKLASVPNSTFKELILPDKQISGQLQINPELSIDAYYKLSWVENRLPVAGSYFASTDIINGGERIFTSGAPFPSGAPRALFRTSDLKAKNSGQGGIQIKWHPGDLDLGAYAVKYHDRNPSIYQYGGVGVSPVTGQIGLYQLVYPEDISAYGVSAGRSFGAMAIAIEASVRHNATLVSDPQQVVATTAADNNANPRYAVGNTGHVNVSMMWNMGPNPVANEAMLMGELAWNRRLSVIRNPDAIAALTERDAWGMRFVYTPIYRQVLPGVDLSVPTGFSYFPKGKSSAVPNFGVNHGGDFSIGVEASYLDQWRLSLNYTHFYGDEGTYLTLSPKGGPTFSFNQALKDRDLIALSIRRTF